MNKLSFIKKYWKIYLIIIIILAGIVFGIFLLNNSNKNRKENSYDKKEQLLFTVSDVSKNCPSNGLKVYNNNKYELVKGATTIGESNLIKTGTYNYDIDKVINSFNDDSCDMERYLNYRVTLQSGESYCISMTETTELNNFLKSLNEDSLFWCE